MATVIEREINGQWKWIIDYYDQYGKRHRDLCGETKKEAETKLREIQNKIAKAQLQFMHCATGFSMIAQS